MHHGMSGTLASGTEILECSPSQCFLALLGLYISFNKPQLPHLIHVAWVGIIQFLPPTARTW